MIHKVTMPKLGETVEVSTIEKWRVKEGDTVKVGDVLCEITTDKATLEVESYHRGTVLRIVAPEKKELPVGTLIAIIGEPGDAIPDDALVGSGVAGPVPSQAGGAVISQETSAAQALQAGPAGGRRFASPRARRAAAELGVDLTRLRGTGPGGRIVEADVKAAARAATPVRATPVARKLAAQKGIDLAAVAGAGPGGKVTKEDVLRAAESGPAPAGQTVVAGEVIPLSAMRRIIAERMAESKRTIPCYYLEMDVDATDMVCLRTKLNQKYDDVKISYNDFILKACGVALRMFPPVNSRWVEGGIQRRGEAHVGLAVGLDDGLLVPVVRDVDRKSLKQVSASAADLTERARAKRLRPDEYQGGCMTVSNLGMYGIRSFIPVVNPGESAILGVGMVQDRVVFRQGGIQVRKMMTLTLAVDHRIVDGAVAAQFLEAIRDALEAPQRLVD